MNLVERWRRYRDNQLQLATPACDYADEMADRIEALEGQLKNIRNVYDSIDLNACVMAPRKLFDLTDAIYADNKGKDQ